MAADKSSSSLITTRLTQVWSITLFHPVFNCSNPKEWLRTIMCSFIIAKKWVRGHTTPFHAENFSRKFSSQSGCRLSPKILIRNENSEAPSTGLFFGHFLKLQVKKTKTQEQNKQNSRILPQILEISAIFVHIYKFLYQNQTYFLKKCPITQELSQKIYRINFSFFAEKFTQLFEFSA